MLDRLRPIFSIQTLLLLTLVALSGRAAELFAPNDVDVHLWLVAIAGGLLGIALGLLRVPDSVSHLTAILSGAGLAVVDVAFRLTPEDPDATYLDRLSFVTSSLRDWYLGVGDVRDTELLLIGVLLQVVSWLLAYLSAWALMRHEWITISLFIPWCVIGGTEVLLEGSQRRLLGAAIVVGLVLLARSTYLRRKGTTDRDHGRGVGSLLAASAVAMVVLLAGLITPENFTATNVEPATEYAMERLVETQESASQWMAETFGFEGNRVPDIDDYPRYTAFDDAFSIGGDLDLSDRPEVVVQTNGSAPYLAAQSYDRYTGRGWESSIAEDFDAEGPDGVRYSPELTFSPGQSVPYTDMMRGEREPEQMVVTPLGPSSEHIFSTGMFYSSDERVSVRMAWRQLENDVYPLRSMDLSTLPPDLTGIVALLVRADELAVEGEGGLMYPVVVAERERITTAREQLARRFVEVSWTVGADGRVENLVLTGQLPVYDDNVSVTRAGDAESSSPYVATSLESTATVEMLRSASTTYPGWVTDSYLALPDSVTSRTIDLSYQVASGAGSAYDQAKAIEGFLRNHITYDLDVGVPESDWDIVDYVLFEYQRGYCEHYASAMTVMLRALGIPARTVVGYFPGELDLEAGGYLYRQQNAHAWTEAFFPGYGWIQFEPTSAQPESSLDRSEEAPPPQLPPTPTPVPPDPTVAPPEAGTPAPEQDPLPIPDAVEDEPAEPQDGSRFSWPMVTAAAVAGIALASVVGWFALTRRANANPRSLFASLVRWGRLGGVHDAVSSTPREYARAVGSRYPERAQDAYDVVDVYEAQTYGGSEPDRPRLERASMAVRELKRAVVRQIVRLGR